MFGNFKKPNMSNILGHSSILGVLIVSISLIVVIYLEIKFIKLTKIEKV